MNRNMIMDYPVTLDVLPDVEREPSDVDKAFSAALEIAKGRGPWNEALVNRDGRGRFARKNTVLGALQRMQAAGKLGGSVRDVVAAPRRNPLARTGPADSQVRDASRTMPDMTTPKTTREVPTQFKDLKVGDRIKSFVEIVPEGKITRAPQRNQRGYDLDMTWGNGKPGRVDSAGDKEWTVLTDEPEAPSTLSDAPAKAEAAKPLHSVRRAELQASIERHRDAKTGLADVNDVRDDFADMTDKQFGDAMRELHRTGGAHFRYEPPRPPKGSTPAETDRLEQEWSDNKRNFTSVGIDDRSGKRVGFNRVGDAKTDLSGGPLPANMSGEKPSIVGTERKPDKAKKDEAAALAFMQVLDEPAPVNSVSGGYRLADVAPGRKVEFNMGVEGGGQRTGRVWADAPKEKGSHVKTTVWVIPDERREGEPAALAVSLHTRGLAGGKRSETGTLEYDDATTAMGELLRKNPRPTPAEEREHNEAWRARMAASRMTPDEKVAAAEARQARRASALDADPLTEATREQRNIAGKAMERERMARTIEGQSNYAALIEANEAARAAGLRQRDDGSWEVGDGRDQAPQLAEIIAERAVLRHMQIEEANRMGYRGERDARIDDLYAERHETALNMDQDDPAGRAELAFAESGLRARGLTRTDLGYERNAGTRSAAVARPVPGGGTGPSDKVRQARDEGQATKGKIKDRYSRAADREAQLHPEDHGLVATRVRRELQEARQDMIDAGLMSAPAEPAYAPRTPEQQAKVDANVAAAQASAARTAARIAAQRPVGVAPEVSSGVRALPDEQRAVDLDSARSSLAYASGVTHPQGTINPGRVAQLQRQIRALESPLPLAEAQALVAQLADAEASNGSQRSKWTARQRVDYAKLERKLKTGK